MSLKNVQKICNRNLSKFTSPKNRSFTNEVLNNGIPSYVVHTQCVEGYAESGQFLPCCIKVALLWQNCIYAIKDKFYVFLLKIP